MLCRGGRLILTVPHRMAYFGVDDRYVSHFRRYEIPSLTRLLADNGIQVNRVEKVLGPLEKAAMMFAVNLFRWSRGKNDRPSGTGNQDRTLLQLIPAFDLANRLYMSLVWLEARCIPTAMATVILVDASKTEPADVP